MGLARPHLWQGALGRSVMMVSACCSGGPLRRYLEVHKQGHPCHCIVDLTFPARNIYHAAVWIGQPEVPKGLLGGRGREAAGRVMVTASGKGDELPEEKQLWPHWGLPYLGLASDPCQVGWIGSVFLPRV